MRLQLSVSDSLAARLQERAEHSGASVSATAAVLLDLALARYEPDAPAEAPQRMEPKALTSDGIRYGPVGHAEHFKPDPKPSPGDE